MIDSERMRNEVIALRELAGRSNGKVTFLTSEQSDEWVAKLRLNIPCPQDTSFPRNPLNSMVLTIRVSSGYPRAKPALSLSPIPFLTNVFRDGDVCYGTWMTSDTLPKIVERVARMVALDPAVTGDGSRRQTAANSDAGAWFISMKNGRRFALPTTDVSFIAVATKSIRFRNL